MAKEILSEKEVNKIYTRYNLLKALRINWESHWRDIDLLVNPRRGTPYDQTSGERRNSNVFDSAAIDANKDLASALHSRLTNASLNWFGLTTGVREIDFKAPVSEYLQRCSNIIHDILNQTNFQTKVSEYYLDLTSLCTAVLKCEEDDEDILNFDTGVIWDYWVAENSKGIIDTVYTQYEWPLRLIIQKFGKEPFMVSAESKDLLERMEREPDAQKHTVIHGVFPRTDRDVTKLDVTNKPFASVYLLEDSLLPLKNSGADFNPYIVSRFSKNSNEAYGRGPGTMCLSDARQINVMVFTHTRYAQKMTDPPLLLPDDGFLGKPKTYPGATMIYRAGTQDRPEHLVPGGDPRITLDLIERLDRKIGRAFYADQLHLLEQSRMTAAEVSTRNDERMTLLSPVLARQHHEFLKPLIDRIFIILNKKGLLPSPPDELVGRSLGIEYTSQIARAQKRVSAANMQQFMNVMAPFMQVDPLAQKAVDGYEVAQYIARQMDIPQSTLRTREEAEEMVQNEIAAAQAQAEADIAQTQAQAEGQQIQNEQVREDVA